MKETSYKEGKVIKGDCLKVMKSIPAKSIDMVLCDLPYGTTNCKWDSPIDLSKLWEQYERIIKDDGAIVLTAQTPFDKVLGASNLKMLRYEWIWEKGAATGHLNAKKMPMKAHENILVFYKKLPIYNPQKTDGHVRKVSSAKNRAECIARRNGTNKLYQDEYPDKVSGYDSTSRYPRSVLKFSSDKQKLNLHKTQKPVALFEYLIKTYSNEGDMILDNAAGSGTTGVACVNLNRKFILIEKEGEYCKICNERINEQITKQLFKNAS